MVVHIEASSPLIGSFALSAQQRRLWRLQSAGSSFCAQCAIRIDGPLDRGRLRAALDSVVERQEILRTTFRSRSGIKIPFQAVHESLAPLWEEVDGSTWGKSESEELERRFKAQGRFPFDFQNGPLLLASLVSLSAFRHALLLCLPALCADARTLAHLVGEIGAAYAALAGGDAGDPEPLPYADFSEWQNELLRAGDGDAEQGRAYWARQDPGASPRLSLPGFKERGGGEDREPEAVPLDLPPALVADAEALAERLGTGLEAVLLAAWKVLLWRLTGVPDRVTGEVFEGRKHEEFADALGLYARCLPVRVRLREGQRFSHLVEQAGQAREQAAEWQEYAVFETGEGPAARIVELPVELELSRWPSWSDFAGLRLSLLRQHVRFERFDLKLCGVRTPDRLDAELQYDPRCLSGAEADRLAERYSLLLAAAVSSPEALVEDLPILGPAERHQVIVELNDSSAAPPAWRTLSQRFEEQARRFPQSVAVVAGGRSLTYSDLDRRARQIALWLRGQGVEPEDRVALFLERSPELIAGLLGILKAGTAYVPLDPVFPADRLAMMLEDGGVRALLTQESLAGSAPPVERTLLLDREAETLARLDGDLPGDVTEGRLVYLLFTSGSTGRPKGVAVEHRQLLSYLDAVGERLALPEGASFASVSTLAADLGNTMIFSALCTGGCLHLLSQETASDPAALGRYLREHRVDGLKIVPSHLSALLMSGHPEELLPRRLLVLGGEASSWGLMERVREVAPGCRILNHYGPTETTVGVTTLEIGPLPLALPAGTVPIGRPLANSRIYLVDAALRAVPRGVPGELLIGGAGLARGYFGRPDLTAERFIPEPFSGLPGERLYRTGDLARWLPDGTIEFLGRTDHQVKIRGFRIELGEIEAALLSHPAVWEAVVVVREEGREKRLVGYFVPRRGHAVSPGDLRSSLASRLPDYMLPSALVALEALPLTPNGKVDRAALPAPGEAGRRAAGPITPPRNPVEQALAGIWSEVLGTPSPGVHDNFFEMGGDSILAIQVIARANQAGIVLNPKQLFEHQTIAQLAAVAGTGPEIRAEQGTVTGAVPLTPIEHWFFEQGFAAPHHWNQAVLLTTPPDLSKAGLALAVRSLVLHHDALRLRFEETAEGWRQRLAGPDEAERSSAAIDFSALPQDLRLSTLETAAADLQASLDLGRGPIARFAHFDLGAGAPGRLLAVVHHLAVDGVSWRILLEDLQTACEAILQGKAPALPGKTSSLQQWAERLSEHALSGALDGELAFWRHALLGGPSPLPRDSEDHTPRVGSARTLTVSLESEETRALLQEVPAAYRTQINDVLLAALARGFARSTGASVLRVDLEGHGREALFADVDLSRTVGWFTTHFPLRLELTGGDPGSDLRSIKEQLRRVPGRGIGYGLLRYLAGEKGVELRSLAEPEVKFNYLGQLDGTLTGAKLFPPAAESMGPLRATDGRRTHLLDVNGGIAGGRLHLQWTYSEEVHRKDMVEALAQGVAAELRDLIAHCRTVESEEPTPSDFPLAGLDDARLQSILRAFRYEAGQEEAGGGRISRWIDDVYPVSPLQESLLVHAVSAPGSGAGFEQKGSLLRGELDVSAFEETWQRVVDRHAILRTAFVADGGGVPLQVVVHRARVPIDRQDWRGLPEREQLQRLEEYLRSERARGFDPSRAPLMRVGLIRLADDAYQFVWSYHHLLLDAWCRNLVLQEVFATYEALRQGRAPELPEPRPFRDYIAWLKRQDRGRAEEFWRRFLQGFTAPTRLPSRRPADGPMQEEDPSLRTIRLQPAETDALEAFTRSHRVTLNALLLGAWGLLLCRYTGAPDVVFGTTVSGRPPELPGVESMLGMFVNNLPVRVRTPREQGVAAWLGSLQDTLIDAREHEWVSPSDLQEWSEVPFGQRLFETLLIVQNYPVDDAAQGSATGFEVLSVRSRLETGYPLTVVAGPLAPLTLRLFHDPRRFDPASVERMGEHLKNLLLGLAAAPQAPLSSVPILSEAERRQLLRDGNGRAAGWVEAGVSPEDVVLIGDPAAGEAALDLLEALALGAPVIGAAREVAGDPERLRELLETSGATAMKAPPIQWQLLVEAGWKGRPGFKALCTGARLPSWLARELSERTGSLFKLYGPAETGTRSAHRITASNLEEAPDRIGRPGALARIFVLSPDLELVPVEVTGEVYVGGELGWGYAGRPAETAERFVPDPFGLLPGGRLFRAGDLACRLPDGQLELRGRVDRRCRVDGQEVDLWQIETELLRHPGLRDVRVEVWSGEPGQEDLVAYLVADRAELPAVEPLRDRVGASLSRSALPSLFVRLDSLPLTPEGRLDASALPSPDQVGTRLEAPYTPPCDPLELRLKQIWEDLFGFRPIQVRDDFFALGGHSLLAVRLMAQIRSELGKDLPLGTLLQGATIERLAAAIRGTLDIPWSPLVRLQAGGPRRPLFCVHAIGGEVLCYTELARFLGPDQPFYGLQSAGWREGERLDQSLEEMAASYIQSLKEAQPEGPYCLAGWSFGGFVALEMAQQLHAAGESIAFLAILDTSLLLEESSADAAELILRFSRQRSYEAYDQLRQAGGLEQQLAHAIAAGLLPPGLDLRTALLYARAGEINSRAKEVYTPQPYPGRVTLFRATEGHVLHSPDPTLGWGRIAQGGLEIFDVPGRHTVMVEKPYVQVLAKRLRACLDSLEET